MRAGVSPVVVALTKSLSTVSRVAKWRTRGFSPDRTSNEFYRIPLSAFLIMLDVTRFSRGAEHIRPAFLDLISSRIKMKRRAPVSPRKEIYKKQKKIIAMAQKSLSRKCLLRQDIIKRYQNSANQQQFCIQIYEPKKNLSLFFAPSTWRHFSQLSVHLRSNDAYTYRGYRHIGWFGVPVTTFFRYYT